MWITCGTSNVVLLSALSLSLTYCPLLVAYKPTDVKTLVQPEGGDEKWPGQTFCFFCCCCCCCCCCCLGRLSQHETQCQHRRLLKYQQVFNDLQPSCNLESLTGDNCTALHLAAIQGYPAVIEKLVGYGADVNTTLQDGNAPLHILLAKPGNMKEPSKDTPEMMKVLF